MRPITSISVLMPTFQGMAFLERVLQSLAAQECALPWDLWVVDSGSSDGTLECLQSWQTRMPMPMHVRTIHPVQFNHGDTRNSLIAMSGGDLCVFLTQDAIPSHPTWLATLAMNFELGAHPSASRPVGAAYCRNVARPDADIVTQLLCKDDPGYAPAGHVRELPEQDVYAELSSDARRLLYNFNDVASAFRRELWERHPFPRTDFGEDVLQARAFLEAGFAIVYEAQATVEHSHDYSVRETFARACIDGRFNAQWLDRVCLASQQDAETLSRRLRPGDDQALAELEVAPAEDEWLQEEMAQRRRAAFLGLEVGGRATERFESTSMLAEDRLTILFVVHGFPPDTWAGTEIYTLNLAQELQRRGHRVSLFVRGPAHSDADPELLIEAGEFEGLRVLRLVHRLQHASLRESFRKPSIERAFARVLDGERPDVVHFQHLIHTSVGLVDVAKARGLATVVTCHDYWALCARVQLIREDGGRCEGNRGAGCLPCVKGRGSAEVAVAEALDRAGSGPLEGLALDRASARELSEHARHQAQEYLDLKARQLEVPAAYAACDLMISPSRFLRDVYLASGSFDPGRLLFSENGMRTDHVEALVKEPDPVGRLRFGFVGSLVWYKGVEVLVRAMAELVDEPCVLDVYGAFSPEQDAHHAELLELAQGSSVQFHGRFDNSRLSDVHARIDVLVVPSLWVENAPVTIQEAFLTRTPLLCSDIGGMAEYVPHGKNGLQFKVGDAADLARQMRRFLVEPDLLERLSQSFPTVKTAAENAAEMEFRYRGLCCRQRRVGPSRRSYGAGDISRQGGPVEVQGVDWLLLRPGSAWVEYDLGALSSGNWEVQLAIHTLAVEADVEQAACLQLDGEELGRVPVLRSGDDDQTLNFTFPLRLGGGAGRLRITSSLGAGAGEVHLRIAGLSVDPLAHVGDTA